MKPPPRSHGQNLERAQRSPFAQKVVLPSEDFIHSETISGILLLVAAVIALVWINSPWRESYQHIVNLPIHLSLGTFKLEHDTKHWINDGLMAIFFFMVALEIKREWLHGELSSAQRAALPVSAAVGGMVVPVAIYLAFNWGGEGASGWAVPMATDIAFAMAVLALMRSRVPSSLRLFLLAFAIVDDIGSILVIAINYTHQFSWPAIGVAAGVLGLIVAMHWIGVQGTFLYVLPALIFWVAVWKSGVHATIAGVVLGFITPARAYAPNVLRQAASSSIVHGIVAGLVLGKLLGLTSASYLAVKLGWATLPEGVRWPHILGAGLIGGIGFTVSLFLTGLAFQEPQMITQAKIGVLTASVLAGILAIAFLFLSGAGSKQQNEPEKNHEQ